MTVATRKGDAGLADILAGRIVLLVSHDPAQIDRLATARLNLPDLGLPHGGESAAA